MGEFWMPSQHRATLDRRFLARDSASGAHVYGKPVTACEAFTSVGPFWEETFLDMKITADQAFADGCNRLAIHNYSQSPSLSAYPGYVYFAGTFYSRTTTWWQQTPAFNSYLGRNQFLSAAGQVRRRCTVPPQRRHRTGGAAQDSSPRCRRRATITTTATWMCCYTG